MGSKTEVHHGSENDLKAPRFVFELEYLESLPKYQMITLRFQRAFTDTFLGRVMKTAEDHFTKERNIQLKQKKLYQKIEFDVRSEPETLEKVNKQYKNAEIILREDIYVCYEYRVLYAHGNSL